MPITARMIGGRLKLARAGSGIGRRVRLPEGLAVHSLRVCPGIDARALDRMPDLGNSASRSNERPMAFLFICYEPKERVEMLRSENSQPAQRRSLPRMRRITGDRCYNSPLKRNNSKLTSCQHLPRCLRHRIENPSGRHAPRRLGARPVRQSDGATAPGNQLVKILPCTRRRRHDHAGRQHSHCLPSAPSRRHRDGASGDRPAGAAGLTVAKPPARRALRPHGSHRRHRSRRRAGGRGAATRSASIATSSICAWRNQLSHRPRRQPGLRAHPRRATPSLPTTEAGGCSPSSGGCAGGMAISYSYRLGDRAPPSRVVMRGGASSRRQADDFGRVAP